MHTEQHQLNRSCDLTGLGQLDLVSAGMGNPQEKKIQDASGRSVNEPVFDTLLAESVLSLFFSQGLGAHRCKSCGGRENTVGKGAHKKAELCLSCGRERQGAHGGMGDSGSCPVGWFSGG